MKLPEAPAPLDAAARAFAGPRAGTVFAGRYEILLALAPGLQIARQLCRGLAAVLMACLAKSPAQRPPTANDLYGALQRVAA